MKKNGFRRVLLNFTDEEIQALISYSSFFNKHSKRNNKIPARIAKQALDIFSKAFDPNRIIGIEPDKSNARIREFFKKYYFEESRIIELPYGDRITEVISLNILIENTLLFISNEITKIQRSNPLNKPLEKNEVFYLVYDHLNNGRKKLKPKSQKIFSRYCLGALSAFICEEIGYPFPTQKKPKIVDYYQSSRNLIGKQKEPIFKIENSK